MPEHALVAIVDDDPSIRESLPDLVCTLGHAVRAFDSANAFLTSDCVETTQCLILDIAMPGISGPDLQTELQRRGQDTPVIFITAHTNEAIRQRMLARGAVACLFKPFSDTELQEALNAAFRVA